MFKKFLFVLICFSAAGAGLHFYQLDQLPSPDERLPAPRFSLPDSNGVPRTIETWKGKVLVINFWATWCAPCRKEIPAFTKIQEELGSEGLQFIGIAIEDVKPVREFIQQIPVNYPMLIAPARGMQLMAKFGNTMGVVPFSVVIDRSGRIVHIQPGIFETDQVKKWVTPLL